MPRIGERARSPFERGTLGSTVAASARVDNADPEWLRFLGRPEGTDLRRRRGVSFSARPPALLRDHRTNLRLAVSLRPLHEYGGLFLMLIISLPCRDCQLALVKNGDSIADVPARQPGGWLQRTPFSPCCEGQGSGSSLSRPIGSAPKRFVETD